MTTRTMGAFAAVIVAAAGMCRGLTSDNPTDGATPKKDAGAASASPAVSSPKWEEQATSFGGSKADTKPCRDVTMQFPQAMQVRLITVVGGQKVKKGEVLVRARDAEVTAAISQQKERAENGLEIQGAEKQMQLADFKYDEIKASKTFAPTEFEEARIAAETAHVQVEQAKFNRKSQEEGKLKPSRGSKPRAVLAGSAVRRHH